MKWIFSKDFVLPKKNFALFLSELSIKLDLQRIGKERIHWDEGYGNVLLCKEALLNLLGFQHLLHIRKVTQTIAALRPNYINTYEAHEEMYRSAEKMFRIAGFPRVIGAIDCTLINIQTPIGLLLTLPTLLPPAVYVRYYRYTKQYQLRNLSA